MVSRGDLCVVDVPGTRTQRHVGLLERRTHSRTRITEAIKQHFRELEHRRGRG
ncbi:MAG: hypothetical protein ACYC0T_17725 [Ramlibacter sp.]